MSQSGHGEALLNGKEQCARCHVPPLFTEPGCAHRFGDPRCSTARVAIKMLRQPCEAWCAAHRAFRMRPPDARVSGDGPCYRLCHRIGLADVIEDQDVAGYGNPVRREVYAIVDH